MTKSMKQPREGVTGAQRDDDLLSLDEGAETHRNALLRMAAHLKRACLVGNPAPVVQRMYDRISHPQPGDLVAEFTAMSSRRGTENRLHGLGILIEHRTEWAETDEEWEAAKAEDGTLTDQDRLTDHAWYVQYGPAPEDVCRWVNCDFVVLPISEDSFDAPIGKPTQTGGIELTRDDVVAGLADSGFQLRG